MNKHISNKQLEKDGYYIPKGDLYGYKEPGSEKIIQFIVDIGGLIIIAFLLYFVSNGLL